MHKIEEIIHLLTEDKTRCMKKRKSISTPIRSRWLLASETTFVSWTGARSAPPKSSAGLRFPARGEKYISTSGSASILFAEMSPCAFEHLSNLLPLFMNANGFGKVEYFSETYSNEEELC
ncbi:hypothetical protein CEXT_305401 [Caerostris extrusa]|uniref:Uncharacterized protein n=1 Tax=Caerostris extrusa TaxID=172846 RepID=A0AAV4P8Q5_CAEEX|nr:hypothetical protein CEXT_305401 [Caerostris extrusa]